MYYLFSVIPSGPAAYVITHEAAPLNQPAPSLTPFGPNVVSVTWQPPQSPNGLILGYTVYRRLTLEDSTAYTVNIGSNDTFSFTNAGPGKLIIVYFERIIDSLCTMHHVV